VTDILVVHLGSVSENVVASSILRGLCKKYKNPNIYWVVANQDALGLWRHNKDVRRSIMLDEFVKHGPHKVDVLINLHPSFANDDCMSIDAEERMGFNINEGASHLAKAMYGYEDSKMSLFQIYYRLAGMRWRGSGYGLGYFPQTKSKKKRAGIAVANSNLRHYILPKLNLSSMTLWVVPFRKNVFRKMDEINRCGTIVTDDMLTLHLSIFLRKYVYFLETMPLNIRTEFFGKGQVYSVPMSLLK